MKSKDKQKCKSKESTIGKIINGFLLFMPLLAIGITCAYAIFNKNAYQSWGDRYVSTETPYTNLDQLIDNREFIVYSGAISGQSRCYEFKSISLDISNYPTANSFITVGNKIYFRHEDGVNTGIALGNENFTSFTFVSNGIQYSYNGNLNGGSNYYYIELTTEAISDVFYYSIDKVEQSPLFNWAKDSILYTTLHNTAIQLNITTTFIPMLLTYWLIISVIYYLYDIILIILHIFHRKIHDLEESI